MLLPLVLAAVGIVVSIIGTFFVRTKEGGNPQAALNIGTFGAAGIMAVLTYFIIDYMLPKRVGRGRTRAQIWYTSLGVFVATVVGLAAGVAIGHDHRVLHLRARAARRAASPPSPPPARPPTSSPAWPSACAPPPCR